jgi:hypothetical protein
MLTCFNLKPDFTLDDFRQAIVTFTEHMKDSDLVDSTGPIGRRQSDTIMDTDNERNHEYFPHEEPAESIHNAVYSKVRDQIFICWEDL